MLPLISYPVAFFWRRFLLGCALVLALGGCTPTYDWRETAAADGAIQLNFPGKPRSETRILPLGEKELPFTLTAVAAGGSTFAVGYAALPVEAGSTSPDAAQFDQVGEALIDTLTRHYPPEAVSRSTVMLRPIHAQRATALPAEEIQAEDPKNPEAPRLLARVFRRDDRWIQVVVLGASDKLSWETARWFVDSVRLP